MVHRDTNTVYSEVEGLSLLLGYKTANAGCCKVRLPLGLGAGAVVHWWAPPACAGCTQPRRLSPPPCANEHPVAGDSKSAES